MRALTFLAVPCVALALLLAGCGGDKDDAALISGNTTAEKALSIAGAVSKGGNGVFTVTEAQISSEPIDVMYVDYGSGSVFGFASVGGPGDGSMPAEPVLWYTLMVTRSSAAMTQDDQNLVYQAGVDLVAHTARHLLSGPQEEFTYVTVAMVSSRAEPLFFVVSRDQLAKEAQKTLGGDWDSFFAAHLHDGALFLVVPIAGDDTQQTP